MTGGGIRTVILLGLALPAGVTGQDTLLAPAGEIHVFEERSPGLVEMTAGGLFLGAAGGVAGGITGLVVGAAVGGDDFAGLRGVGPGIVIGSAVGSALGAYGVNQGAGSLPLDLVGTGIVAGLTLTVAANSPRDARVLWVGDPHGVTVLLVNLLASSVVAAVVERQTSR